MIDWKISLDALLRYGYNWPLPVGSLVQFTLINNPSFAQLENDFVYVGNSEDADPGEACNFLTYHGSYTNETIVVRIECGEFSEDFEVVLPIQYPSVGYFYTPPDIDWSWENGTHTSKVRLFVSDAQYNEINNQVLVFSLNLGEPVDMESDDDDNPYTEITSTSSNGGFTSDGRIDKDWIFQRSECPPPQGDSPGTITVDLNVTSPGTEIDTSFPITLYRYP